MTDHEGAADELAAVILGWGGYVVNSIVGAFRILITLALVLAVVAVPFWVWGVVHGW